MVLKLGILVIYIEENSNKTAINFWFSGKNQGEKQIFFCIFCLSYFSKSLNVAIIFLYIESVSEVRGGCCRGKNGIQY
jgi:hypothetical protein